MHMGAVKSLIFISIMLTHNNYSLIIFLYTPANANRDNLIGLRNTENSEAHLLVFLARS